MVCGGLRSPGSYSGTVALTTRIRACAYAMPRVHHDRVTSTSCVHHPLTFTTITISPPPLLASETTTVATIYPIAALLDPLYCLSSLCFLVFFPVIVSAIIIIIIIAISHHHY